MTTAGELLARWLARQGIDAVYGRPLAGVTVTEVDDPDVASKLAAAHRRVNDAPAAVHTGGGRLLVAGPAPSSPEHTVTDPRDLLEMDLSASEGPLLLHLDLDLAGPAPDAIPPAPVPVEEWREPDPRDLEVAATARSPVVLAGPDVIRHRAVPGLYALATGAGLGVLNTWGAKGVLDWRSRHHWATVGLQARDFELGGLTDADLIVATGLDADEAPAERWQLAPSIVAHPRSLGPLAERWCRPRADLLVPPLRAGLAAVTQEGWSAEAAPLAPTRATLDYALSLGPGGLVAADAGVAGYWVARTVATTEPGAVHVPARADAAGFGPACALVARLRRPSRRVLALVDGPVAEPVHAVLEAADHLGVGLPVEVWDPSGPALAYGHHLDRLARLVVAERPRPLSLATDPSQLGRMIDVAGPVVAWAGSLVGST